MARRKGDWITEGLPRNFPLTVTGSGYVKRIGGRPVTICGKVQPDEALRIYHAKALAASAQGEFIAQPEPEDVDDATVSDILNRWIRDCRIECQRGELSPSIFKQYKLSAKRTEEAIGHILTNNVSPDLVNKLYSNLADNNTVDSAKRSIGHFRTCCRHAEDMNWCRPVRLGRRLVAKLASRPVVEMKWTLYTPEQVANILRAAEHRARSAAGPAHRAVREQFLSMLWLAINGGYGSAELSELTKAEVDLNGGVIDHSRGKTGKKHVVPLWSETIASLRPVLLQRTDDEMLYRTQHGNAWCRFARIMDGDRLKRVVHNDRINETFVELVTPLGLKIKRQGFYKFKHLSNTTADAFNDPHATFALYGHGLPGAKKHYVKVGLDRLRKLGDSVRAHLLSHYLANPVPAQPAFGDANSPVLPAHE